VGAGKHVIPRHAVFTIPITISIRRGCWREAPSEANGRANKAGTQLKDSSYNRSKGQYLVEKGAADGISINKERSLVHLAKVS